VVGKSEFKEHATTELIKSGENEDVASDAMGFAGKDSGSKASTRL
jgi:hypothetical protein